MKRYDPELVKKVSTKLGKTPKYIREQISKRALKHNISPEAELANWARSLKISADPYIRKLPAGVQGQIYSPPANSSSSMVPQSSLRIVRIGKDEDKLYNQLWFQIIVLGIAVSVVSQILGTVVTNLTGLTKP